VTGTGCALRLLGDGIDGVYDRVEYKYNRLGHVIWTKDPNETVHEYAFDGLGRQTADRVTLPQDV
jgi:YD repeat-containing protein